MATISAELQIPSGLPPRAGEPLPSTSRLDSVDLLRGIIMVVMSLDHLREFLTYLAFTPEDLTRTWPALFFTRWITHFCAPLFFFLAGTGAYLRRTRGRSGAEMSRFLLTRGLWLVFLEMTVLGFGWTFRPWFFAGVIWALGFSMVILAGVVRLPFKAIAALGLGMILLHNLLDNIQPQSFGKAGFLWSFLHAPGFLPIDPKHGLLIVLYVLIPWVGVMAAGYALGAVLNLPAERRRKLLIAIGATATVLFVILRATNVYGNPTTTPFPGAGPFVPQHSPVMSLLAFLNVEKYPPSLQFLLMTLGPGILALAAFDRVRASRNSLARVSIVFGRVPFFYYVIHIYLAHLIAVGVALGFHHPLDRILHGGFMFSPPEPGYGHGLPFIYLVWILMNVALYFPCRWYAEYKRTHRQWWLSYL
jgi:uncharacterized membrane protein